MPSKKQYDLVTEDCGDALIPLHSEEAFKAGINFHVKVSEIQISSEYMCTCKCIREYDAVNKIMRFHAYDLFLIMCVLQR